MFNQIKPSYKCGALAYRKSIDMSNRKCLMHANVVKVCLEFHISYSDILMKTVNFSMKLYYAMLISISYSI